MKRPTAALFGFTVLSVCLAVWLSYSAFPSWDAEFLISEMPQPGPAAGNPRHGELHVVREYPLTRGCLRSPFLFEHPTRDEIRDAKAAVAARRAQVSLEGPVLPPKKEPEIRLTGIASSDAGRRAFLYVGGRHIMLAPGEEKDGVTLISLTDREATVSAGSGERTLTLGLGLGK